MNSLKLLYDDTCITVCEKPIGVSSEVSEAGESMPSLLAAYYVSRSDRSTPYPLHRLDLAVGGLMVYAKNKKAASVLSRDIAEGRFDKGYFAVCAGDVEEALGKEGELFDYLFKDSRKNKVFVVKKKRQGVKEARLRFHLIEKITVGDEIFSLVFVTLMTGRTHQIRVQFSSRGFPLYGDGKYGSRHKGEIALFLARLAFSHPDTKEALVFTLSPPDRLPFSLFGEVAL